MNLNENILRIKGLMGLNERVYGDDEIISLAKNYSTPSEFYQKKREAATQARQKGEEFWNMVTSHMKKQPQKYFCDNPAKIYEDALQYDYLPEFTKNSALLKASKRCGIFDEVTEHMKKLGSLTKRLVYAFEFPDNSVYVGLTHNMDKREKQHEEEERSAVAKHFAKIEKKPFLRILSKQYIDAADAQAMEGCQIEKYKKEGWHILNSTKAGSLGACKVLYTKEMVINLLKTVSSYDEFQKSPLYGAASRNKWLKEKEIEKIKNERFGSEIKKDYGGLENTEIVFDLATQFETYNDFRLDDNGKRRKIYSAAKDRGLLDKIKTFYDKKTGVPVARREKYAPKGDIERIQKIFNNAIQYDSYYDFHYAGPKEVRPIYTTAKEDKLLDDIKKYYSDGTLPPYMNNI